MKSNSRSSCYREPKKVIGLIDSTKLGKKNSTGTFAHVQDIDLIITDNNENQNLVQAYREEGVDIAVVEITNASSTEIESQ